MTVFLGCEGLRKDEMCTYTVILKNSSSICHYKIELISHIATRYNIHWHFTLLCITKETKEICQSGVSLFDDGHHFSGKHFLYTNKYKVGFQYHSCDHPATRIYTHYSSTAQFLTASIVTIIMIVKNLITRLHLRIKSILCFVCHRGVVIIDVISNRIRQLITPIPRVELL